MPLFDLIPAGKSLIAYRGFEIEDLLIKPGPVLNTLPFLGKKVSLSEEDVRKTV